MLHLQKQVEDMPSRFGSFSSDRLPLCHKGLFEILEQTRDYLLFPSSFPLLSPATSQTNLSQTTDNYLSGAFDHLIGATSADFSQLLDTTPDDIFYLLDTSEYFSLLEDSISGPENEPTTLELKASHSEQIKSSADISSKSQQSKDCQFATGDHQDSQPLPTSSKSVKHSQVSSHSKSQNFCSFCKSNGEREEFCASHVVKDPTGVVVCPTLRAYVCPLCGATGPKAHTQSYCPLNSNTTRPKHAVHKKCGNGYIRYSHGRKFIGESN